MLRIAFLTIGLLLAYQLVVTLRKPVWIGPVTNWLCTLLAWSAVLLVALVSFYLTRSERAPARFWWLMSAGLLCYALACTLWLVEDQFLFPNHVPLPAVSDLFFLLEYPWYLLALLLMPRDRSAIRRSLVLVDACLLIGAAVALSWYFLLAPIYLSSHETLLGKVVHLGYPVGDLLVAFGLSVVLVRYTEYALDREVRALLVAAFVCLAVADSWQATLLLNASRYQAGSPPDLFRMGFNLLLLLAGLVLYRLTKHASAGVSERPPTDLRGQDLVASLRITFPIAAALLASAVLIIRAELRPSGLPHPAPLLISLGLLVLALLRQALTVMDNERLRREREEALRQTTERMETFLGVSGHELRNPLTSLQLGLHIAESRIRRLLQCKRLDATEASLLLAPVAQAQRQEERMNRLVNDLVDVTRVRAGKMELNLALTDLATIVREAALEQRQVNPERTIVLEFPPELRVPVLADAQRIGQVVTNYLTNALKYSAVDRPVAVGLQVENQDACVWVRDEGPGLPAAEQERIWASFHRAQGIVVQSGSGVGLGLGLHISQTIIEQHQGEVGVRSTPGQGSTFWFTLPLATPEPAQEGRDGGSSEPL